MKIIQVNCVYGVGSTGKIVKELHSSYLKEGHDSYVLYGREGIAEKENNVYKVSTELEAKIHSAFSRLFGVDFGYSFFATRKIIKSIKSIKPDVVHLHCLNGHFVNVYKLLKFLKKNNIKTVLTLHAELMHTAGCEHAMECEKWKTCCSKCEFIKGKISHFFRDDAKHCYKLMKYAFDGFNDLSIVGCSKWIMERAAVSPIFSKAHCGFFYVYNNVDTSIFHFVADNKIKEKLNIPLDKKMVLNVTSKFSYFIKGPKYFIEIARKLPEYYFVIVGFDKWEEELPKNVITIEKTKNQKELAEYYSAADCFISTSIRENLPTVCLEASACCCNVLAFDSGGAKETISNGMGDVVKPYDINEYVEKIKYWARKNKNLSGPQKNESMPSKYLDIYEI